MSTSLCGHKPRASPALHNNPRLLVLAPATKATAVYLSTLKLSHIQLSPAVRQIWLNFRGGEKTADGYSCLRHNAAFRRKFCLSKPFSFSNPLLINRLNFFTIDKCQNQISFSFQ